MPLPFDMPPVSRGYAELGPAARGLGRRAAEGAARGLSRVLGFEVGLAPRALPGPGGPRLGTVRLGIDLCGAPSGAVLEAEATLVARLVDRLAGGDGGEVVATDLTPIEGAALELFALAAAGGACEAVPEIEERLAPRLVRRPGEPDSALGVDLAISSDGISGRARLLVSPHALRELRGRVPGASGSAPVAVTASLRSGAVALPDDDLAALAPGDVVLLDVPPCPGHVLAFPGGFRAAGRVEGASFQVEETTMPDSRPEIPITIEVELARFPMPLAEIARIEPGAILALPVDRRGIVTLRAGDHAVARGELVDVDGAVGVRILSLEATP